MTHNYIITVVPPYFSNLGKRLVKTPKVYISDSGIVTALLNLHSFTDLLGHPSFGSVWETVVLSNLKGHFPKSEIFFYRSTGGAEIDFILKYNNHVFAVECKASYAPKLSKGNYNAIEDTRVQHSFIVIPDKKGWPASQGIDVVSLKELIERIGNF